MAFRLTGRSGYFVLMTLIAGLLLLAFLSYVRERERSEYRYFSDALAKAGLPIADGTALPELRLAYARASARRAPQLALPGVDPDALERAVASLDASQKKVIAVQATSTDATMLSSLYPLRFLKTLPDLERARRQFVASGSAQDRQRYEERMRASIAAESEDIGAFGNSLKQFTTKPFFMVGLGGGISSQALRSGLSSLDQRLQEVQTEFARRGRCFDGDTASCSADDIAVPVIPDSLPTSALTPQARAQTADIKSFLEKMFGVRGSRNVVLSSSLCLGALPGPYAFTEIPGVPKMAPFYINDIFFQRIDALSKKQSAYLLYLWDTYQIKLLKINPMMFYMCPTISGDIGRIRAIEQIDAFAASHPEIAPAERNLLRSSDELREDYALGYLRAAFAYTATGSPERDRNELIEIALMYRDLSAGLEEIISSIALTNGYHATVVAERGVPIDMSAKQMFLTHSAYPTLFLSLNQSAGTSTVLIQSPTPANLDLVLKNYALYSALKSSTPRNEFIREIEKFRKSEGYLAN